MVIQTDPFQEIADKLIQLRQSSNTRQKFPQEIWESIFHLAQSHSLHEISSRLNIGVAYLKKKNRDIQGKSQTDLNLDFKEISVGAKQTCPDMVLIELVTDFGLRASIQGPSSCLSHLSPLFRR